MMTNFYFLLVTSYWCNINEVIRAVLNFLFFFAKRFHTHKKHQKAHRPQRVLKAPKSQKAPKITKKHKNATKQKHKTQISEQI